MAKRKLMTAPKNYHHGDLKQVLLAETARILAQEGPSALSLRRLAANIGVSRAAPYNHFENKEALLAAVAEEGFRRFEQSMRDARNKQRGSGGRETVRAIVQTYLEFALDNPQYYDLMYGQTSWQGGAKTESLALTARRILRQDIERLERLQSSGLISADLDVVYFERIFWGTMHGISRLCLDGVYADRVSIDKLCDHTADFLWKVLQPSA